MYLTNERGEETNLVLLLTASHVTGRVVGLVIHTAHRFELYPVARTVQVAC